MRNHIWGLKHSMTSGEWTCLISFATEFRWPVRNGENPPENFKMKIYVSSGIRTHTPKPTTGKLQRLKTARPRCVRYQVEHYIYTVFWNGMWQYLYGIGYGLIPNVKFCKQLLHFAKIYNEIRNESLVWHSGSNTRVTIIKLTRVVT